MNKPSENSAAWIPLVPPVLRFWMFTVRIVRGFHAQAEMVPFEEFHAHRAQDAEVTAVVEARPAR